MAFTADHRSARACGLVVAVVLALAVIPDTAHALRQCGLVTHNGYLFRVRSVKTTCIAARPIALRRLQDRTTDPYRCDHPNGRGVRLFTCLGPAGRRVYISLP